MVIVAEGSRRLGVAQFMRVRVPPIAPFCRRLSPARAQEGSMLMESDYVYRLMVVTWARCLLEWARACKAPAFGHEGSSPSAPMRRIRRRIPWVKNWVKVIGRLSLRAGRWVWRFIVWVMETPVYSYRLHDDDEARR